MDNDSEIQTIMILNMFVWFLKFLKNDVTSLVAQWLRILLPMQGTRVQALLQEDPTCHGAARPTRHNY